MIDPSRVNSDVRLLINSPRAIPISTLCKRRLIELRIAGSLIES